MMADIEALKGLQEWFTSQCNGSWEHTYGISITTLDNPGWSFKVELADTRFFGRTFNEVNFKGVDNDDWYVCRVKNSEFEGPVGQIGSLK